MHLRQPRRIKIIEQDFDKITSASSEDFFVICFKNRLAYMLVSLFIILVYNTCLYSCLQKAETP